MVFKSSAGLVDIVDRVSQVAKISVPFAQLVSIPVMGQLNLRLMITGSGQENERESPSLDIMAPNLLEAQRITIEG